MPSLIERIKTLMGLIGDDETCRTRICEESPSEEEIQALCHRPGLHTCLAQSPQEADLLLRSLSKTNGLH